MKRFWEVDFLRGVAIIAMIALHFVYDIYFFGRIALNQTLWWVLSRATAAVFIFLVGVSLTLSYARVRKKLNEKEKWLKYTLRGFKIFIWGLIITAITWVFMRERFVIFGILHFIGVAIILAHPFLELKKMNLYIGSGILLLGLLLRGVTVGFYWLLPFGIAPAEFVSVDFFPLIPWFGLVLIGIFVGNKIYPNGKRKFKIKEPHSAFFKAFCFLGKNSLLIYLLHQPVLVGVLYVLGFIPV